MFRFTKKIARTLAGIALSFLPERVVGRILPSTYRFDAPVASAPPLSGRVRLVIAPANSAGQAFEWCRAVERADSSVGAQSMMVRTARDFRHEASYVVPVGAYSASGRWHRRWSRHVLTDATHVIVESQRPPLGAVFRESTKRQVRRLQRSGIEVAMLCHGSDIRLPSRHAQLQPDSPFANPFNTDVTQQLEKAASSNAKLLHQLGLPVFVSTPDLLIDVPTATWLPVVVRPDRWACLEAPMQREVPVVVHAPSSPWIKGSSLIEPAMRTLHDEGLIEYRTLDGVPHEQMPRIYTDADIVLDQFRIGSYGVAACEAMAAGRVVVGFVSEQVRNVVADQTRLDLPIVQALAQDLETVIAELIIERSRAREIAAKGPTFVREVHDGRRSALALSCFLDSSGAHVKIAP